MATAPEIFALTKKSKPIWIACFEYPEADAAFIAKALGDIARAKGMSRVARDAGMPSVWCHDQGFLTWYYYMVLFEHEAEARKNP